MNRFLDSGDFDINSVDSRGYTPLSSAIDVPLSYDNLGVVKLLLENGADIKIEDNSGHTALHHAALGQPKVAKLLVEKGANWTVRDKSGKTALDLARKNRYLKNQAEVIQFLEELENTTPLHYAIEHNHLDIFKKLFTKNAINITDKHNSTLLSFAITHGRQEFVEFLVNSGADPSKNFNETTYLHLALSIKDPNYNIIKKLLEKGAKRLINNNYSHFGGTPLKLAIKSGRLDLVELLIDNGVELNPADEAYLHYAIDLKQYEIVEKLLEKDVGVNERDERGLTPLRCAITSGKSELVKLLLEHDADVNIGSCSGISGETHLYWAIQLVLPSTKEDEEKVKIVRLLLEKDAKVGRTELQRAITQCNLNIVKLLVEKEDTAVTGEILKTLTMD